MDISQDACGVCFRTLGANSQICQFCSRQICRQHLRKKRKCDKDFKPICDICQDGILFETNLRYQVKTEQTLDMQLQILKQKHNELKEQYKDLEDRKQKVMQNRSNKLNQIETKMKKINQVKEETLSKLMIEEENYTSCCEQLDSFKKQQIALRSIESDIQILDKAGKNITKQLIEWEAKTSKIQKQKDQELQNFLNSLSQQSKTQTNQQCIIF